jgi:hypothetical protein
MNFNNYVARVEQNGVILNSFCIPSKNLSSAEYYAHSIAQSLYSDIEYKLIVKVVR